MECGVGREDQPRFLRKIKKTQLLILDSQLFVVPLQSETYIIHHDNESKVSIIQRSRAAHRAY